MDAQDIRVLRDPMLRGGSNCVRYCCCWMRSPPGIWTALTPVRPYPLQHLLNMRDRGFRLDAMAQIENQAAAGEICKHVVDRLVERGAARDQRQRIEISLHRDPVLHTFSD